MRRIVVVGGPGSGKTTVAAALATALGVPHVELDALWWEPGWTPATAALFESRVRHAIAGDAWVVDGNYLDEGGRAVWRAADTLVWLDLPRRTCIVRVVRRSASRVVRGTKLWGTNRQRAGTLSPRSIARLVRRWRSYPARIEALLETRAWPHLRVVRLRTDEEVRAFSAVARR